MGGVKGVDDDELVGLFCCLAFISLLGIKISGDVLECKYVAALEYVLGLRRGVVLCSFVWDRSLARFADGSGVSTPVLPKPPVPRCVGCILSVT